MKSKILATVLVILSVVLYTLAVINFIQGDALGGIADVALACSDVIIAFVVWRQELVYKFTRLTAGQLIDLIGLLKKGVPATLTIRKGNDDEEDDPDEDEEQPKGLMDYAEAMRKLHEDIDARDAEIAHKSEYIDELAKVNSDLKQEIKEHCDRADRAEKDLEEHKQFLRTLLPIGQASEPWVPQPELIKSVYASAGVMKQVNEHTDAENLMKLWEQLKAIHKVSTAE